LQHDDEVTFNEFEGGAFEGKFKDYFDFSNKTLSQMNESDESGLPISP